MNAHGVKTLSDHTDHTLLLVCTMSSGLDERPPKRFRKRRLRWLAPSGKQSAHCAGASRYFSVCALAEAVVGILGVLLVWMGWWDLCNLIVPPRWYWSLLLACMGGLGLFFTRALYPKHMLQRARELAGHAECTSSNLISTSSSSSRAAARASCTCSPPASPPSGTAVLEGSAPAASLPARGVGETCTRQLPSIDPEVVADVETGVKLETPVESPAPTSRANESPAAARGPAKRVHFAPPRPNAKKCARALLSIVMGLTLWVGLWDLIDYHLLPLIHPTCHEREAGPDAWHWPGAGCVGFRLGLVVVGLVCLWATRSLYGDATVRTAMFQHAE